MPHSCKRVEREKERDRERERETEKEREGGLKNKALIDNREIPIHVRTYVPGSMIDNKCVTLGFAKYSCKKQREIERDRETERNRGRERQREGEREIERETEKERERTLIDRELNCKRGDTNTCIHIHT